MKLFILCTLCILSLSHALSKNAIENIRKELNEELTQLEESESTKNTKRSDNNQIASAVQNDDEKTDFLRQIVTGRSEDGKKSDLWSEMVNARKNKVGNSELDKLFGETKTSTKKSVDSGMKLDSLDALSKLLVEEESKARKREMSTQISKKQYLGRYIPPEECNDQRVDCKNFKEYCQVPDYRLMMRERCPETCKACSKCDKKDKWSKNICERIVKLKYCNIDDEKMKARVEENCYKSCGYCRAAAPPACNFDPAGCCWDGLTFAKEGCNTCEDSRSFPRLCKKFKDDCTNKNAPGIWMKKHCPVTCGMCDPTKECHDIKQFNAQCKQWAAAGDCDQEQTRLICPRTCKACPNQKKE